MRTLRSFLISVGIPLTGSAALTLQTNEVDGAVGISLSKAILWSASNTSCFLASNSNPLPSGLMIAAGCEVVGTPTAAGTTSVILNGVNTTLGQTGFGTVMFVIAPAAAMPLMLTTVTVATGTQNQPYSFNFNASGGTPPYAFAETGTLPGGLSFGTAGVLSGTPTTAGTFPITVTVTDSKQAKAMQSYVLVVNPGTNTFMISVSQCPNLVFVGTPVSCQITEINGTPPITYAENGLPPGLTATGNNISGMITTPGSYPITITGTDANHSTFTTTWNVVVTAGSTGNGCDSVSYDTSTLDYPSFAVSYFPTGLTSGVTLTAPGIMPPGFIFDPTTCGIVAGPGARTGQTTVNIVCGQQVIPVTITVAPLPAQNPGEAQTIADPVSTATGEISDRKRLLSLGGPLPLTFEVFYSTLLGASRFSGAMGNNWMHNFEVKLTLITNGVQATLMGGKTIRFSFAEGIWTLQGPEPNGYQLISNSFGYQLLDPTTRCIYMFTNGGALKGIQDRNGNTLTVTTGTAGPTDISDGLGRTLHFSYQGSRLTSVMDQSGRSVSFGYTLGALTSLTDATGATTNFSYTSVTGLANGLPPMPNLLVSKQMPAGNMPYTQGYDTQGNVSTQTDSLGNNTLLAYSTTGHTTTVTDARGNSETDTNLYQVATTSTTDANGSTTSYSYDGNLRRTSVKDHLGNVDNVTYHQASGYPASVTDPEGNTTTFNYAAQSQGSFTFYNLTGVKFADGASTSFSYDSFGNVLTETDEAGKITAYTYNSRGQVVTAANPGGGMTKIAYNPDATIANVQDAVGNATSYSYDNAKRVTGIAWADGTSASVTYDAGDRVLSATDERGNTVKFNYDVNGNPISATDALNKSASAKYDTDDLLSSVTDPAGNTTALQFDSVGNLSSTTNGAGEEYTYSYDASNRLTSIADPSGKGPSYSYDKEDRPISAVDALSDTATFVRDSLGRVVQAATPLNELYSATYDALGRVTSTTDPLSNVTSYSYEARGFLTGIAAPGGITASFGRDDLGLPSSVTDPNGSVWTHKHDSYGRLISDTDPLGRTVSYTYDARNRVKTITNALGSAQLSYDAAGNLTQRKYSDGTTLNYSYDPNNRLTGGDGFSIGYDATGRVISSNGLTMTRDGAGRILSVTYAPGKTVNYTYDSRGLLARVSDWAGGYASFVYDAARRLVSLARSNGVTTQYTYDRDGRVTSIVESGTSSALPSIAPRPQEVVTTRSDPMTNITYNQLGDTLTVQRNFQALLTLAPGLEAYTHDAAGGVNSPGYLIDGVGQRVQDPFKTYGWNVAGQLKTVSKSGSNVIHGYDYDAIGGLIGRRSGTSGTAEEYILNYGFQAAPIVIERIAGIDMRYTVFTPFGTPPLVSQGER